MKLSSKNQPKLQFGTDEPELPRQVTEEVRPLLIELFLHVVNTQRPANGGTNDREDQTDAP